MAFVVLAGAFVITSPATRANAEFTDPCRDGVRSGAASEHAARALAEKCDATVEVLDAASETTKVFAQPSGDFSFESWAEPQWARRNGNWTKIDTTLTVGQDGLVRPVASTADVVFSPGGKGAFATMTGSGASFSLGWADPLPQGVIAGDTITYPNVYPDVDLVVRAERSGFSHLLVVKTAAAAANPLVRETRYVVGGSAKVSAVGGGVTVSGPEGLLAAAPPAEAWDSTLEHTEIGGRRAGFLAEGTSAHRSPNRSTVRGPGDSAKTAPVDVRISDGLLSVSVAPELLDTGNFPIFIDPTYDKKWASWAPVNDSRPSTQWTSGTSWPREVARVGSNYEDHGDIWRSHFYFDTSALAGKRLTGTVSLDAYVVHTGDCNGESISVWQTNSLAANTPTWNGMKDKWLHGAALQTKVGKANGGCSPSQSPNWMNFNGAQVGHHVQRHADEGHTSITFGLRMETESGGRWAKFDPANVKLKTDYQHKPHSPVAMRSTPGGNCVTSSPGPWITNRTPTLFGKASDGDGTVKIRFDLNGPTTPADHTSGWTNSGKERSWPAPTLAEGNYNWRVRGTDGVDDTDWTGRCYFRLDHTPPTSPAVTRTSGTPVEGQPVTLSFTSSDARSGMKQFAYGIGVDAQQNFKASSGTTTITFTPETGRTVVYVWAQDNAGNYSARTAYNFFTGRITEAQPHGAWRFDGDARDDSGEGHDLTAAGGVGYGPDRKGNSSAAMTFDGAGCAETTPVIRTDAEYTVAGWVNLNDKSTNRALVTQAGSVRPSFYLQYHAASDRWELAMTSGDVDAPSWAYIQAGASPPQNAWQHIAATVDPVARVMRLYVGGQLAAEGHIPFVPWNAQSKFTVGCAAGTTDQWHQMRGSIDHLGVWQGLLSEAEIALAATELPAGEVGTWQLRGSGIEATGRSSALLLPEIESWVDDQFGRIESAVELGDTQCAKTEQSVLRTDESFTVAAWAKLATVGTASQTVIGQDGNRVSGWYLGTRHVNGVPYWTLMMKDSDDEHSTSRWTASPTPMTADVGKWTHLAGSYDASAQRMSLYINGSLVHSITRPVTPWKADGAMTVGCALHTGVHTDYTAGAAISEVRAWRGVLGAAEVAGVHGGNPEVKLEGMWPLDGPASDTPTYLTDLSGNGRDLTITGPYAWVRDRGFGRDGALGLELAEGSCAETTGPVVRTDASFTVAAWVLLEQTTGHHTVVSQAASGSPGFNLGYHPGRNRWQFGMPATTGGTPTWHTAESLQAPELGRWTHLAGVYDLAAGKVRLYVDGVLHGEVAGPANPWMASGPTLIGCNGTTSGTRDSQLGGVVDDVRIWTSTVDPDRIADLAAS
ncbi:LamG domain-containing protein [Micromonospora sp. CP22]|uniref:LamG domain-containing protein n=1 Tax=Micromonospora sp. CP22 TaxID=2580517 RepID=UPI0012BB5CC0|nr:LamG domain-containing protein [Micromonospora sp. CP22]MTK01699.1 LamG domain-containing protein [Micromonospora sp. CP22]